MNKSKLFYFVVLMLFTVSIKAQSDSICINKAKQSLNWLNNNESVKLYNEFDKTVAAKISAEETATIWKQIISQVGDFVEVDTLITNTSSGNLIVDQVLKFEKTYLKYRLSFDDDNKISGIFFIPYKTAQAAAESTKTFDEIKCSFVNEGIEFPAIYCTPKNQKTQAVVILVHGSGPNDMDETIGPNKIFKQIANKLASYGIASLRYDKRSYFAQQGMVDEAIKTDINSIVVSDAIAAANYISRVDSLEYLPRILVGHSLGGYMAPQIAMQSSSIDAIVMLAANARPLEDLIIEQYRYLYARDGMTKVEKKAICKMKRKVKNVKKLEKYVARGKTVELPLVNDVDFWLSLNKYDPLTTINNLQMPILIIQGRRDYQVSEKEDFLLWKSNSKQSISKDKSFLLYYGLNHLFIKGNGNSYPEEYNKKGNVSDNMIKDMADWIKSIWNKKYNEPKLQRNIVHLRHG